MQILRIFVQKFHYQWRLHDKTLSHFEVFHIFEPTIFLFFSNPQTLPIPDDLTTFALSEGYMKYFLLPNDDEISSFVTLVQKKMCQYQINMKSNPSKSNDRLWKNTKTWYCPTGTWCFYPIFLYQGKNIGRGFGAR